MDYRTIDVEGKALIRNRLYRPVVGPEVFSHGVKFVRKVVLRIAIAVLALLATLFLVVATDSINGIIHPYGPFGDILLMIPFVGLAWTMRWRQHMKLGFVLPFWICFSAITSVTACAAVIRAFWIGWP